MTENLLRELIQAISDQATALERISRSLGEMIGTLKKEDEYNPFKEAVENDTQGNQ